MSRRKFLATGVAGATASVVAPRVITAKKTDSQPIVGEGEFRYEVLHDWPQLPAQFTWQTTHNVAIDRDGFLYVIHEGQKDKKDHPSIFVFDPQGRYVRSFGSQFQGGGHGLEVREEEGQQYLYVCAYQHLKTFAKLDLKGEVVWQHYAPMSAKVYAAGEDTHPEKVWGRDRFMPTNFAFPPEGGFLLADGYGSYYIHRYDPDGKWQGCFGGPGEGNGTFNLPHGIGFDARPGREPEILICDRAHHTLQRLTPQGAHIETLSGYGLPANVDFWNDLMVVPELYARVSILNARNQVVARLGDDSERIRADGKHTIRRNPRQWKPGKFVHPHDACFDQQGNIYVAEWVATGRVTKLKRLA
jgi:hypothetical protein